jgi:hypothetical protein
MTAVATPSGHIPSDCELVRIFFSQAHRVFAASGVEQAQHNQDFFRFRHTAFYSQLKSKVDIIHSFQGHLPYVSTLTSMTLL